MGTAEGRKSAPTERDGTHRTQANQTRSARTDSVRADSFRTVPQAPAEPDGARRGPTEPDWAPRGPSRSALKCAPQNPDWTRPPDRDRERDGARRQRRPRDASRASIESLAFCILGRRCRAPSPPDACTNALPRPIHPNSAALRAHISALRPAERTAAPPN